MSKETFATSFVSKNTEIIPILRLGTIRISMHLEALNKPGQHVIFGISAKLETHHLHVKQLRLVPTALDLHAQPLDQTREHRPGNRKHQAKIRMCT